MKQNNDYAEINETINNGYYVLSRSKATMPNYASKSLDADSQVMTGDKEGAVPSKVQMKTVLQEVLKDEEIRGFYGYLVDAIVQSGYRLEGEKKDVENAKEVLDKLKFNKIRKGIYFKCLTQFHNFIELIYNKERTKVVELKHQPNYLMEPVKTKRGILKRYIKNDYDGKIVKFNLDEMVHISVEDYDGTFWNTPQIVTLQRLITLKNFIMEALIRKFDNNEFKNHFHLTNTTTEEVEELIRSFRISRDERDKFLVTAGKEGLKGYKLDDESSILPLIQLLNKVRNMMLTLIRVPPIIAGTVDNSNRSNSDTQANFTFIMRIKSFLIDLEDELNSDLLPKLGLHNVTLRHNTINLKEDKEWLNMGNQLVAMGASKSKTLKWLNSKGLELPNDLFELTENEKQDIQQKEKLPFAKNSNLFESRKPQDKGTENFKTGADASTKM